MNAIPVREYGCRVLTPTERMDIYTDEIGEDEATIKRIAQGIATKRRMLAEFRNIDARKAAEAARKAAEAAGEPVVIVKQRPRLTLQR